MVVRESEIRGVVERLQVNGRLFLDTETTGLNSYAGDRLFAIIIGDQEGEAFYFNFNENSPEEYRLPRSAIEGLRPLLENPGLEWVLHNAKFDMHMLSAEGITISGPITDTEVMCRLENNTHLSYALSACAKRIGEEKSDAVEAYIKKHRYTTKVEIPGKKGKVTLKHFDKVPFEIMAPYGEQDVKVTRKVFLTAQASIAEKDGKLPLTLPQIKGVAINESKVTKVLFNMERRGIKIDVPYCRAALAHERERIEKATREFTALCGKPFLDSGKYLAPIFEEGGETVPSTDKGNASIDDAVLAGFKNPVAACVREHRDAYKRANTYFSPFLYLGGADGIIHPNFRQAGTTTGRFSCSAPNLQNVTKSEEGTLEAYPVRRAFVPREGYNFVEIDYKAMEFRLLVDHARERDLAKRIMNGEDPHQVTADLTGLKRKQAKTLNFGLLYGMGAEKLSIALGCTLLEAKRFRSQYFGALPNIQYFITLCTRTAETRGMVFNWAGRQYQFPDPRFSYKACNAIIQGGSADIVKRAMVSVENVLYGHDAHMVLQVHDSLLLEVRKDTMDIVPAVVEAMRGAYLPKCLPMDCSTEWSDTSW